MKTFVLIVLVACIVTVTWADSDGDHLLGRPDGHEQRTGDEPIIGRPDGLEPRPSTETPLIGRPDGHEPQPATDSPLIGRPDGHEPTNTGDEAADNSEEERGPDDTFWEDGSMHPSDSYFDDGDEEQGPETENPGPAVDPTEQPDGHEPLVRCKRPICEMMCEMGFKMDSLGCQICECRDAPSVMPCPEPMCANECPAGYKNNAAGCMTCDCEDSENHGPLEQAQTMPPSSEQPLIRCKRPMCMMFCTAGFKLDHDGCPLCQCRSGTDDPPHLACPEPMCANYCPAGYKKNAAGCTVCQCAEMPAERQCEGTVCLEGQVCRNRTNSDGAITRTCSVKTLCEKARSEITRPRLGQVVPQCEADGSYSPVQFSGSTARCWCVDGRGQEIAGSNRSIMNGEEPPLCVRNVSLSMHIHMTLYIYHDVDLSDHMDTLNATIIDHVSSWLTIDPHFILLTKADPIGFDESYQSDESNGEEYDYDPSSEPRTVVVEMIVIHDGSTDLLSASDYMQHRIEQGNCGIPIGGIEMKPRANTVEVRHEFIIDDTCNLPTKKQSCVQWLLRTGRGHIVLCVSTVTLFTLVVVATIYVCCRRRHRGTFAFKHQRLDHQESISSDKTLLKSDEYVESPELLIKEKLPIV